MLHKAWIPECTFFDIGALAKIHEENGLKKIFGFWGQTTDVSDQAIFTFKGSVLHDE